MLFDRYVIVDWSASSSPKSGKDSIWIAVLDAGGSVTTSNPPTRGRAEAFLRSMLIRSVANGERVLVGFDFPYGYPDGFAEALDLRGPPWRATWQLLAERIRDSPESNGNNRFKVAAELNARVGTDLFWGRPTAKPLADLSHKRDRVVYRGPGDDASGVLEWRAAESVLHGGGQHPQPVWKLFGNGSVGSQSLTGIPVVARLRDDPALAAVSTVWPFEVSVPAVPAGLPAIIHAEVWPSMIDIPIVAGRVKDEVQVMTLAADFRNRDRAGTLAKAFEAVPSKARVEEGWILGLGVDTPVGELDGAAGVQFPVARATGASTASGASHRPPRVRAEPPTSASDAPMDLAKARQFIADVPVGRWTAYKDVAIAAGNARGAQRIGQWLYQSQGTIAGYWRVLTVGGLVPDAFVGGQAGPVDAVETRELLRQEGVQIDPSGKASPAQRFTVEDLIARSRRPLL